jgi:hypothetical protein
MKRVNCKGQIVNLKLKNKKPAGNSKFVQKWLTVVQLRFFVINFGLCGATLVLQVMPFMHKFSKRYA